MKPNKQTLIAIVTLLVASNAFACIKTTTEGTPYRETDPGNWACDRQMDIEFQTTRCAIPPDDTGVGIYKVMVTGDLETTYRDDSYTWAREPDKPCETCPPDGVDTVTVSIKCINLTPDMSTLTFDHCKGGTTV